jgi:hypothetical protein
MAVALYRSYICRMSEAVELKQLARDYLDLWDRQASLAGQPDHVEELVNAWMRLVVPGGEASARDD